MIDGLLTTHDGQVAGVSNGDGRLVVLAGNEAGFRPVLLPLSLQPTDLGREHWQVAMEDHKGAWWVPGTNRIRVFAPVSNGSEAPRAAPALDLQNSPPRPQIPAAAYPAIGHPKTISSYAV